MKFFNKSNTNNILTVIFLILMVYLIGMMISNVVDRRLGDIEIRMPRIEIRPEQFTQQGGAVAVPATTPTITTTTDDSEPATTAPAPPAPTAPAPTAPAPAPAPTAPAPTAPAPAPAPTASASAGAGAGTGTGTGTGAGAGVEIIVVNPESPKTTVECTQNSDCNTLPGQTSNVCLVDNTCLCDSGSGAKCADNTYYKDPASMNAQQLHKFKYYSSFEKMTLKDYTNWLSTWTGDVNNLAKYFPTHLENYEKNLTGKPVTMADLKTAVVEGVNKKRFAGVNTAQNLYNNYFATPGMRTWGEYPEIFAPY